MHILMLSDVYFPRINGVSTSIQTFARSFIELGHRITLIAPEYPYEFEPSFEVLRIPARRLPFDPEDRLMSLRAIKRLLPRLETARIDLVHIQTPFVAHYAGVYLARVLGVKAVVSYHTFFEAYFEKYLPWVPRPWLRALARRYSRKQCNQVDGVISPSRQMLRRLQAYGVERRAAVIPTGLPPESFRVVEDNRFREHHDLPAEAFLLLYVGRVAFEKNIEFLLSMFAHVRSVVDEALLLVAGEGPALERLRERAHRMGQGRHVRFIGYLDRATELLACYQTSDVFVFASQTETQGLVLLEAMASGLPVVSTASMGSLDVLIEGQGCLIAPPGADAFARRVIALYMDRSGRRQLSARGVAYARGWGDQAKAMEMLDFYRRLQAGDTSPSHGLDQVGGACIARAEVKDE
jgi:glycosyltransferase involved in cell wall biosynthesis